MEHSLPAMDRIDSAGESPAPAGDSVLVRRLKRRDKRALEEMLRVHGSKLYGVAIRFMRKEHDAEEVMQDALLSVWRKIGSFDGRSAFTSWLYRVTANAALMALRKQRRYQDTISLDDPDQDRPEMAMTVGRMAAPDSALAHAELGVQVRLAIDRLPEAQRLVVLLFDVEGFSMEDVIQMTHLRKTAIKSRLHRGRLAVRKTLLPYLNGEGRFESPLSRN